MGLDAKVRNTILTVLVVLGAGYAGWSLLSIYTVRTYQPFLAPARSLLTAALARNSVRLARQVADPRAVRWMLDGGNAAFLRTMQVGLRVGAGRRHGDTTLVAYDSRAVGQCAGWPLVIFFTGPADVAEPRVERVAGGCRPLGHV